MPKQVAQRVVKALLSQAGVQLNGRQLWDIEIKDERLYGRLLRGGSIALGESFMDNWWDCPALDQFAYHIFSANLKDQGDSDLRTKLWLWLTRHFNMQSVRRAWQVGQQHYDVGNDLFQAMLDPTMTYSCGYWQSGEAGLNQAQLYKLDLVCRKLGLEQGMHLLDIGCGWGSLLIHAAQHYGVSGVGVTVSEQQVGLARHRCRGLPIDIRLQDYRQLDEKFDRVVSIGMVEHVGYRNYRAFMEVAQRCLTSRSGLFLLHTIGSLTSRTASDPWLDKYIFPNCMVPSIPHLTAAAEGLFVLQDFHNFGSAHYDMTAMAWWRRFDQAWPVLSDSGQYDKRFYRMWKFYLQMNAGVFRAGRDQVWQLVFSKEPLPNRYQSVR